MNAELMAACERLCASGRAFDRVVRVLKAHQKAAVPILVQLLAHPDPGWSGKAAAALARMKATPARAVPSLLKCLRSGDASVRIMALAALESAPAAAREQALGAVIRLLSERPVGVPSFTRVRSNLPRGVAAHFLGLHGGERGRAALLRAARRRNDPIAHHIEAALQSTKERAR
jgi:hypothetical protein